MHAVRVGENAARVCFALVFAINVQCALGYVLDPQAYVPAFQLSGVEGSAAVAGIGIAFLMWNATYPAFIVKPSRFMALGAVVVAQQIIGFVGESVLFASLPHQGYELLASSIARFMLFDGIGLVIMGLSYGALTALLVREKKHAHVQDS